MTGIPNTVRVRLEVTLLVDVDGWATEYGTAATAAAVRADVRAHVVNELQSSGAPATELWEVL
jgi:hypothetical protein